MPGGGRVDKGAGDVGMRIVIVSEIRLYRDGLARVLSELDDVAEVLTCDAVADCVGLAIRFSPHIILLDMTATSSASSARLFAKTIPRATIVAIAVPETEPCVLACVEAGVTAYVPRKGSIDDLFTAIRLSARGEALCSPVIAAGLMRRLAALAQSTTNVRHLTTRELEIAEHIALGMSNRDIAGCLGVELCTVKNHVHNILEKLGANRRSDVVDYVHSSPPAVDLLPTATAPTRTVIGSSSV
jgi:two-component system, NarL family, nitrate/nitrite response regulator NarL